MNLRMTMGAVTSIIGDRYLAKSSSGIFKVEYHKPALNVAEYAAKLQREYPLQISSDGKIKSGILFLTPVYRHARYCAYLNVEEV